MYPKTCVNMINLLKKCFLASNFPTSITICVKKLMKLDIFHAKSHFEDN